MSRRLEVLLHGHLVGHLTEVEDRGVEFRLVDSYRELVPRPVLGQKFEDDLDRVHRSRRGQGLPDFFANLIPEREGRLRQLIEQAAGLEPGDDLGLLAFVGQDLPGAVVVQIAEVGTSLAIDESPPLPLTAPETPASQEGLRFSLAGVQLKFSMLLAEDKLTLPSRDQSGEWIVKFDSPAFPNLPENEYSILEWARRAGFDVPQCALRDIEEVVGFPRRYAEDGTKVLAIRRYDRSEQARVHQEDFAQAVGLAPTHKYDQVTYEGLARLAARFIDDDAVDEMVRRLVLVIASGNSDAHLKNWSLVYPGRVQARWSPIYDQVATVAWKTPPRELSLKLAGVKDFRRLDRVAFERFATKVERDQRKVLETVDRTLLSLRQAWAETGPGLALPKSHAEALRDHWQSVPLLREAGPLA